MGQVVRFLMIFEHESEDLPVPPVLLLGFYQQKSGVFLPSRSGFIHPAGFRYPLASSHRTNQKTGI